MRHELTKTCARSGSSVVRRVAVLAGALCVAAPAAAQITVTVSLPAPGGIVGEAAGVTVEVTSPFELSSIVADVSGKTGSLTYDSGNRYTGTVTLTGLARGTHPLVVTATDALGNVGTGTSSLFFDTRPQLVLDAPLNGTAAHPLLRVQAECVDDDAAACTISIRVGFWGATIASFSGPSVDESISLAGLGSERLRLWFTARDSVGQYVEDARFVWPVVGDRLEEVDVVDGPIKDAAEDRILYETYDGTIARLHVLDRSSRAVETLHADPEIRKARRTDEGWGGGAFRAGRLTARGAVATPNYSSGTGSVYHAPRLFIYADGIAARITDAHDFVLGGDYVSWDAAFASVHARNVVSGVETTVPSSDSSYSTDVGPNGLILFLRSSGDLDTYDGTTDFRVATGISSARCQARTDGTQVVFSRYAASLSDNYLWSAATGQVELSTGVQQGYESDWGCPQAANGWVAFMRVGPTGVQQVWLRHSDGTEEQLSFFSTEARLDALAENGSVLFASDGYLYEAGPGMPGLSAPICASDYTFNASHSENGTTVYHLTTAPYARAFHLDDAWHIPIGRSLFRVRAETEPMDGGVPDAGGDAGVDAGLDASDGGDVDAEPWDATPADGSDGGADAFVDGGAPDATTDASAPDAVTDAVADATDGEPAMDALVDSSADAPSADTSIVDTGSNEDADLPPDATVADAANDAGDAEHGGGGGFCAIRSGRSGHSVPVVLATLALFVGWRSRRRSR